VPPEPPPSTSRGKQVITAYAPVIDAWLRAEILLKGTVIHERLAGDYGFAGNYQRVKMYLQEARPRIAAELGYTPAELARLHRRFEVVPGAQAQVDWGDEGGILAHAGIAKVYSFHMVLSYSRDPFCCFTASQDLATFFACHRRAFDHFGGVPGVIVYDRTKTVVRRHVAPGKAVPLHPEAAAFAGHYGFGIDVLAAYRPTGKGRVERQVLIVRDHVLAGRSFSSLDALDRAFLAWVPVRRATVHRTHGEVIGARAQRDHAALAPVPVRRISSRTGTCGTSARTAWSRSRPTRTPSPRRGCSPASWSRSAPRPAPSACTPPCPTGTASPCSRSTSGRSAAAPASSTRPTGTGFPTGIPGP
jgi:transposase